MKVAIPVAQDCGLESLVYSHFGSAPAFLLVDSETRAVESLRNSDREHAHGQCSPLKAFAGCRPDAVVVGGIGAGALRGLRQGGVRVYQAAGKTVAEIVALLQQGGLKEIAWEQTCAGHGPGSGCAHHS